MRLAHQITTVQRHGGSLPRAMPALPPIRLPYLNVVSMTIRYDHSVILAEATLEDKTLSLSHLTVSSKRDSLMCLFLMFSYVRLKYADVWFVPKHGMSTFGDYTIHLIPTPFGDRSSFDPDDPDSWDVLVTSTNTTTRKAWQTAHLRYVPLNEIEAAYISSPSLSSKSTGGDMFHLITLNNPFGVIDPSGATTAKYLYGEYYIDAHFTFKGSRLAVPKLPRFGIPSLSHGGKYLHVKGMRVHLNKDSAKSCMYNLGIDSAPTGKNWYSFIYQYVDLISRRFRDLVDMSAQAMLDMTHSLADIWTKIPVCANAQLPDVELSSDTDPDIKDGNQVREK